jgi:phage terminase small subunit
MSLTTMQELFVRALLSDPKRNATTAAGYSEKRAGATARELLSNPEVRLRRRTASVND